jgi:hypothetical protein
MAQQTMTQAQRETQAKGDVTCKTIRYIEHREEMLAYQKRYHEENHDAFLQYQKEYYQRTKEAKKERYNVLVHCDCCQKDVRRGAIANHRKTKKHMRNEEASNAEASNVEASNAEANSKTSPNKDVPSNEAACGKMLDGNEAVDGEVIVYVPYSKCALQIDELDEEIVYSPLKQ